MADLSPKDALPAGTRLAHYEIAALIGAGGMGHVYPRARFEAAV